MKPLLTIIRNSLLGALLLPFLIGQWARAGEVSLLASFFPSEDSVTYNLTVQSAAGVAPGIYQVIISGAGGPYVTVLSDGTIEDDVFYGMTATISPDSYAITFQWTYYDTAELYLYYAGAYSPPYPYDLTSQPPYIYYDNSQDESMEVRGPINPFSPSDPTDFDWNDYNTVDNYFYHNWVQLAFGNKDFYTAEGGTIVTRTPYNKTVNRVCNLPPGPDKSPPYCSIGCSSCKGMAGYSFDLLRGSLRLMDTPVSYSPPVGSSIGFTITYNQADLGQETTPLFSNFGPQWTCNWLSYITNSPHAGDVTRFVPGGGLEYYFDFTPQTDGTYLDASMGGDAVSGPERNTRAVLNWDDINKKYTRTLPDGSSQTYAQAVVNATGATDYLISSDTDAQGNTISYGYDSSNRLVSITDAIGQVTTLSYESTDELKITKVTDPFGRSAIFQYDSEGRLSSSTDVMGLVSSYAYDSTNFITALTTPYGTTTFATDSDGNHHGINATNPLGQTERAEVRYNSVSAIADTDTVPGVTGLLATGSGLSSNNSYYWTRRQYSSTPDYTQATITHWMNGPRGLTDIVDSVKKPLEDRVWYNYQGQTVADYIDDSDYASATITTRLLDPNSPGALSSSLYQANYATYNTNGMVTQSVDPLGRTTNYNYDTNNIDLLTVTQSDSGSQDTLSTMTYNSQHEPLTVKDASNQTTTMTYNTAGQPLTRTVVVGGSNQTTTMAYTGPSGSGTGAYLTSVTGPTSGATTSYTYDSYGRVHTVTDSEGYVVTTAYDAFDRPTTVTYPDSTTDQTVYKNLDVVTTIDRQGRATKMQYDAIRELLQTTDPMGRTTKYSWCTCGGLSTLTDANGNVTTWNLDIEGRVTGKVYADSSAITYTYAANTSRLYSMTDAVGNGTVYAYNLDNTLASSTYTPASGVSATHLVSFTYDSPYNRVLTMTDGTGTTTYSYKPITGSTTTGAGRLSSVSVPIAGSSATVTYGYDELGRVTSRGVDHATTDANDVATTFDALGRVTGVTNPLGAFTYAYVDQTSRLSGVTYPSGTGLSTSYSYFGNTGDQRLETIQNFKSGTTNISKFDYTYNAVGTIATWTQQADSSTAVVNTLTYDNADQLTNAVQSGGGSANNAYAYDPAGNRLAETTASGTSGGQFNTLNQLIGYSTSTTSQTIAGTTTAAATVTVNSLSATTSGTSFTASVPLPNGTNVVSVVAQPTGLGSPGTKRYQIVVSGTAPPHLTYDANGNTLTDENGNGYAWDALNRLTKITYSSGATSNFAYDGLSRRISIIEKNSGGTVTSTKNYLWIGQEMAEERDASNTVTKRFLSQGEQQSGTAYYYFRDHLGSVREMLNSSGTIVARYGYDPYGVTTLVNGSNLATKQYAGYYVHQISGLDLTKYRALEPNTGRWLSRDPIAERGGNNLYEYVGGDPEDFTDPSGLLLYRPPPVAPTIRVLPYIIRGGPWAVAATLATYDAYQSYQIYQMNQATEAQKAANDALEKKLKPRNPAPPMPAPNPKTKPTSRNNNQTQTKPKCAIEQCELQEGYEDICVYICEPSGQIVVTHPGPEGCPGRVNADPDTGEVFPWDHPEFF